MEVAPVSNRLYQQKSNINPQLITKVGHSLFVNKLEYINETIIAWQNLKVNLLFQLSGEES